MNDRVSFLSFDSLCNNPKSSLERLGEILELKNIDMWMKNIDRIKPPKPHVVDTNEIPPNILGKAEDLFIELQKSESF